MINLSTNLDNFHEVNYFLENAIYPYFQPIFSLKSKKIIAYEGLSRFLVDGTFIPFPKVYEEFKAFDLQKELDWQCRKKIIEEYPFKNQCLLFVNILMSSVESEKFGKGLTRHFAENCGISPSNIVLELVEVEKVENLKKLLEVIQYYKSQGFKICLDDFGTGYNTIEIFFELSSHIDYIKIPLQIVKGVSKSWIKHELLKTFKDIALNLGLEVIAEGIEFEEDLKTLLELGVDHGQGFLFAKPMPKDELLNYIPQINFPKVSYDGLLSSIHKWLKELPVIEICNNKFKELLEKFNKLPQTEKFAEIKLKNKSELYILNLWEFARLCADPVKFNLVILRDIDWFIDYAKKHKGLLYSMQYLGKNCQLIDVCDLTSLLDLAIKFQKSHIDFFIILEHENPKYYLLKEEVYEKLYKEIYKSRIHVNPLTGLPANIIIEDVINSLLKEEKDFFVGYLDIDNFKAFNDNYGFLKGDLMIKRTAFFLNRYIKECYENKGFVGHIGGDDFVFVVEDNNEQKLREITARIINSLERNTKCLFSDEDVKRGYFVGKDREGNIRKFPVASFSIAVVNGKNKKTVHKIAKVAAKLKKIAKNYNSSKIIFESDLEKNEQWLLFYR
ncbi:MAG: GGDEF domain-containing protein [Desulfonauticus sp.]|nr:GGDEF domain-containing protein [Desulfonauticus sp.]